MVSATIAQELEHMVTAQMELRQSGNGRDLYLEVVGSLTFDQADQWRALTKEVWARRPARLLVDLSRTSYLDTSGVALLVSAACRARRHAIPFQLSGLSLPARRVLRLTRLEDYFQEVQILPLAPEGAGPVPEVKQQCKL